ncbi:hypothetical protein [Erwinia amylovora]|uniref:hypothetical protein n=1 Tax=Erwinia amylovora TaxID=552 RepID=UPI00320AF4E0
MSILEKLTSKKLKKYSGLYNLRIIEWIKQSAKKNTAEKFKVILAFMASALAWLFIIPEVWFKHLSGSHYHFSLTSPIHLICLVYPLTR